MTDREWYSDAALAKQAALAAWPEGVQVPVDMTAGVYEPRDPIASGKSRVVWWRGLWWRTYTEGGYDGYRSLRRRLPCGELARRKESQ